MAERKQEDRARSYNAVRVEDEKSRAKNAKAAKATRQNTGKAANEMTAKEYSNRFQPLATYLTEQSEKAQNDSAE